jgi:predicted nucleic acid-binding protein
MVIETAVMGRADSLITRDDDLKADAELGRVLAAGGIKILTVRRFLAELAAETS